jgi:hypothetical protein
MEKFDVRGGGDDGHGHTVHIRHQILDRLGPQHLHLNLFAGRSFGF